MAPGQASGAEPAIPRSRTPGIPEDLGDHDGFLSAVLTNLSDALVACNADGQLTLFNPAAQRLHGLPATPIDSSLWSQYYRLYQADGATLMQQADVPLLRALRGEVVHDVEMVVVTADGARRTLLASGQQIVRDDGQVRGAVVVMHDITALRAAEQLRVQQGLDIERRRATERALTQLQQLNAAALAVNRQQTVTGVLDAITEQAAAVVGARQAVSSLTRSDDGTRAVMSGVLVDEDGRTLAAPLLRRDGSNLGLIQLSDKLSDGATPGEFDAQDQALLVQLAQLASLALEKAVEYEREHQVAVELQRSLLPHRLDCPPGLSACVEYLPGLGEADLSVGGDFYDLFDVGQGRVALALGDVVGHGLRSASLMGQIRSGLRALAMKEPDPAEVLPALDGLVATLGEEAMATLAYGVLDVASGQLRLALAGHPPPMLRTPDGVVVLDIEPGLPLGTLLGSQYPTVDLTLPTGAALLMYSDGLVEIRQRSIAAGLTLLQATFASAAGELEDLCSHLIGELTGGKNDDDVALLVISRY